jgi:UDP-N-acetylglucosamine 4,6-dehydratase
MTRFWITIDQGVDFVIRMIATMSGGELFVPRIPSMRLVDLATAVAPQARVAVVGIRPGEKLHEEMIGVDDARHTRDAGDFFVMQPDVDWWSSEPWADAPLRPPGFRYTRDANTQWLSVEDLRRLLDA